MNSESKAYLDTPDILKEVIGSTQVVPSGGTQAGSGSRRAHLLQAPTKAVLLKGTDLSVPQMAYL